MKFKTLIATTLSMIFGWSVSQSKPVRDKYGKEWPECVPPDPADNFGQFNNNLTVNGTPYYCSPDGKWEIDQKAVEAKAKAEREQRELLVALGTRKLTPLELKRVNSRLNIFEMQGYSAAVKYAELYDLLVRQWELQTGTTLPVKTPLSRALGDYNRAPQEHDNQVAVERMVSELHKIAGE